MYRNWVRSGWLIATEGDCIDYDKIRDDILKDAERFNIKMTGFDVWNATHLRTQLQAAGLVGHSRKHTNDSAQWQKVRKF